MSGTSMDGVDAVLVEFPSAGCRVHAHAHRPYPEQLLGELRTIASDPGSVTLPGIAALDVAVAEEFAATVRILLEIPAARPLASLVAAIGSHGQTVLHAPGGSHPATLQLGDPALIAARTGRTVVGDFRRGDVALGGQGAPLVPAFHRYLFGHPEEIRAVVNIGGIANVSLLSAGNPLVAFDTGPGNTLLDAWCREHRGESFDRDGNWAAGGTVSPELLERLMADSYFHRAPPKSTGVDYFNLAWLSNAMCGATARPVDVQATLAELTAATIVAALGDAGDPAVVAVCGGGARNSDLMRRLGHRLGQCRLDTTAALGMAPEFVEAAAFAWFARERLAGRPTNAPEVTGARARLSMGGVYLPPEAAAPL